MRSLIAQSAFTILAAVAAIALGLLTMGAAFEYGLPSPGLYVVTRLHPDPPPSAPLGSMLATMLAVDSSCWFVVLCVSGWLLNRKPHRAQGSPTVERKREIPARFWVLCACLVAPVGFLAFRTLQSNQKAAERVAARQRAIAEAPTIVDQQPTNPLPREQALIVREIGGLYPWLPNRTLIQSGQGMPSRVAYSLGYTTTKDPLPEWVRRVVLVEITQYPNVEWARYRAKYPGLSTHGGVIPSLTNVKKFGQTVVQDATLRNRDGSGVLCFAWPHETFAVSVCYETPEVNEEFVREYLEKYPSSL